MSETNVFAEVLKQTNNHPKFVTVLGKFAEALEASFRELAPDSSTIDVGLEVAHLSSLIGPWVHVLLCKRTKEGNLEIPNQVFGICSVLCQLADSEYPVVVSWNKPIDHKNPLIIKSENINCLSEEELTNALLKYLQSQSFADLKQVLELRT